VVVKRNAGLFGRLRDGLDPLVENEAAPVHRRGRRGGLVGGERERDAATWLRRAGERKRRPALAGHEWKLRDVGPRARKAQGPQIETEGPPAGEPGLDLRGALKELRDRRGI